MNDYSRRQFLKKFAALSSASLLFGINAGCGPSSTQDPTPEVWAMYGPAPITDPAVSGIYYAVDHTTLLSLDGHQDVPIYCKFVINFTTRMNTATPPVVTLVDNGNNAIVLKTPVWETAFSASVMPSAALLNNSNYILSLTDATDETGNMILIDSSASATFKTVV